MLLAKTNPHPRDQNIKFQDEGHIYTIAGVVDRPISVTTLIHNFFPAFNSDLVISKMMKGSNWINSKYFGQSKEQIKDGWKKSGEEASKLGTLMHADIERYLNNEKVLNPTSIEFKYFLSFWQEFNKVNQGFYPHRTEWLVYDEDKKLAGSIDCVLSNASGELVILDWKRSKEIKMENKYEKGIGPFACFDNCNLWHYTMQLNLYRHVLETRYGKTVLGMYIVVLHPNNDSYLVHLIQRYNIAAVWDSLFEHSELVKEINVMDYE
jgi:ATP-dependent exoDNAse (exonuclease V) beta subunit